MTATAVDAPRWTCDRCAVSVGRIDGHPVPRPVTWAESEDGTFCLSCSRAIAAELAVESAGGSDQDRARLRRTALIEFEIRRLPDAPNRTIAQACRTSTATVAAVRDKIE
jgi:hypothetical protein